MFPLSLPAAAARSFTDEGPLPSDRTDAGSRGCASLVHIQKPKPRTGGQQRAVLSVCEGTGLGIFCDDEQGTHYHADSEGIYWLTDAETEAMAKLA